MKNVKKVMVSLLLCAVLLFSGVISAFAVTEEGFEKTADTKMYTVYFDNNRAGWENVFIYYIQGEYWDDENWNADWEDGDWDVEEWDDTEAIKIEMTKGENNIYSAQIPVAEFTDFLFTDGKNQRTDLDYIDTDLMEDYLNILYIIEPCIVSNIDGMIYYSYNCLPLDEFYVGMKYTDGLFFLLNVAEMYLEYEAEYMQPQTYETLKNAYEKGKALFNRLEDATQEEIDAHTTALYNALSAIEFWHDVIGDVTLDDYVNMKDVLMVQKHVAELLVLDENQQYVADVNGDETVDMQDVLYIQKFVAGLIELFPVEQYDETA